MRKTKILFVAEAVTLAHLARPLSLAGQLDDRNYDVVVAADPRYAKLASGGHWQSVDLASLTSKEFLEALARGSVIYDQPTLERYVSDDLALIEATQPDVVVGDFRLSLSVSARVAGVPYACITNGYWSPAYTYRLPMPVLPMSRRLPLPLAEGLFRLGKRFVIPSHCRPLNAVRRRHGLPSLGSSLRRTYTDADIVLCADACPMIEPARMPTNHVHLGPLSWSPAVPTPDWFELLPSDCPVVYVTLGSSGPPELLATVLTSLASERLFAIASTAGSALEMPVPANARVAEYLDGGAAVSKADLVICNGGSPTTQQALVAGVPVLGLPSNMDQMLNMSSLVRLGVGESIRADRVTGDKIRTLCRVLLRAPHYKAGAQAVASAIQSSPPAAAVFRETIAKLLLSNRTDRTSLEP